MHNSPEGVSLTLSIIPWGPALPNGLGWELLCVLLCLGRAASGWDREDVEGSVNVLFSYLSSSFITKHGSSSRLGVLGY